MFIRFWGARGSIPVSGQKYIKYGGNTTCVEIRSSKDDLIIIDAGSGIRELGNLIIMEKIKRFSLIFTHAHWDHILGFPFFKPIYFKNTIIDMYGCMYAQHSTRSILSSTMKPPTFPVPYRDISASINYNECKGEMDIGTVRMIPIPLSHPNAGFGYKFIEGGKSFVFLTDNELSYKHESGLDFDDYVKFCEGTDLLVHDAEFTEDEYRKTKKWGHSAYTDAARLANEANVKQFGLFHHNQERSDSELDRMVSDLKSSPQFKDSQVVTFAICENMTFFLTG